MPAWLSNFTAKSQVEVPPQNRQAVVSFYRMQKEACSSELLNRYMTDRPADETEGEETEKEERTKIGIVKLIDAKDKCR